MTPTYSPLSRSIVGFAGSILGLVKRSQASDDPDISKHVIE